MLPPRWTLCPAAWRSRAMMVVVVVFPSLPVTARIGQAHPRLQQQAQQRLVAHADADDRHALPLKGVQIVL